MGAILSDMSDYYSVMLRAVNGLPLPTSAARQEAYQRARYALLNQLRNTQPPVPEANIAAERRALDEAIALVEAQFDAKPPEAAAKASPVAPKRRSFAGVLLTMVVAAVIGFEIHANLPLILRLADSLRTQAFTKLETFRDADRGVSPRLPNGAGSGRESDPRNAAGTSDGAVGAINAPDRASSVPPTGQIDSGAGALSSEPDEAARSRTSEWPRTQTYVKPETPPEDAEQSVSAQPGSGADPECGTDPQCALETALRAAGSTTGRAPGASAGDQVAPEHSAAPLEPAKGAAVQPSESAGAQAYATPEAPLDGTERGGPAQQSQAAKAPGEKAKPKKKPPLPPRREDPLPAPAEPSLLDAILRGFRGGESQ